MDMADRRARIESLLTSPLENHSELRALLLPDGEDSGPKPWLPQLPEPTDEWKGIWALVGEAMVEAFAGAKGDQRAHAVSVMAVAPHPSSTTLLLQIVEANTESTQVLLSSLDGLVVALGPDAAPHLRNALTTLSLGTQGRAVENLSALPPEVSLSHFVAIVRDETLAKPTRKRALKQLVAGSHADALASLQDLDDPAMAVLVEEAFRPKRTTTMPLFAPDLLRFVPARYELKASEKTKVAAMVEAAVEGHKNGAQGLLGLADAPELLSLVLEGFGENEQLAAALAEEFRARPDGISAFVGREVISRGDSIAAVLVQAPPAKTALGVLGEFVVGLRGGADGSTAWSRLPSAGRVEAAEYVSSWRGAVPEGLAQAFLADPSARVAAAGARLITEGASSGGADALAQELRTQLNAWGTRRPADANGELTRQHVSQLRLESSRYKVLGWWGEGAAMRQLRKSLLEPEVFATCVVLDGLCGGFEQEPDPDVFSAVFAAPSAAVRIEAMLRWHERRLGPLPAQLANDPDGKVKNVYRRLS